MSRLTDAAEKQGGRAGWRWWMWLTLLVPPFLLALILYWPTLQLPLVYDTILHTQLADDLNWLSVWRPSEKFGFYRPLVFAPLLLIHQLFNGYPAALLHGLNIAQHALNALLLTWLVWRLWADYRLALVSGLLFATYPFAYQATIVYGNNAYLTVTGVVLLGLHAYVRMISSEKLKVKSETSTSHLSLFTSHLLLLTLFAFFVGVLIHETAILLIPLCILLTLIHNSQFKIHNSQFPTLLILSAALILYLIVYLFLPRGGGPLLDYGGNDLWPKLLIFMQAAAYPFVWLAHRLPDISAQIIVVGGFLLTAAASATVAWFRPSLQRPLLFGWGWWLAGSLLVGTALPTYYIADGARLLYFGGVGVALVWAAVLTAPFVDLHHNNPQVWQLLSSLGLIFILITSLRFIQGIIHNYTIASEPLETIERVMAEREPDNSAEEAVVMVNFPQWVSPPRNTYATGNEWSPIMGDHLFMSELLRINLGTEYKVYNLTVPSLLTDTNYNYGVVGARTVPAVPLDPEVGRYYVFISRYGDDAITTDYTGQIVQHVIPAVAQPRLAIIGQYDLLDATAVHCGAEVHTQLTLIPNGQTALSTVSLFVQVLATDGRLLAQADGPPLGLAPEQIETHFSTQLIDQRTLTFTEGEAAQLLVGLYDYTTGDRFPAVDAEGQPLADNALRIPIDPCTTAN